MHNKSFCSLQRYIKLYKVNTGGDLFTRENITGIGNFFVSFMLLLMKADVFGAMICCLLAFNIKIVVCYPIHGSSKQQS